MQGSGLAKPYMKNIRHIYFPKREGGEKGCRPSAFGGWGGGLFVLEPVYLLKEILIMDKL